jgi:uncharacterized phage protein (TIGR01671 family)
MSRPIEFRAWSYKENKFYFYTGVFNIRPYIEHSTFGQYESSPEYTELEIDQWTGLYDKNRKKIFEGDILRYRYKMTDIQGETTDIGLVTFKECAFRVGGLVLSAKYIIETEIIGTGKENPDLVKAKHD